MYVSMFSSAKRIKCIEETQEVETQGVESQEVGTQIETQV